MSRLFVATYDLRIFPIFRLHGSQIASVIIFRANESLAKELPPDLELHNAERKPKTLKGRFDSPNQGEFPGKVTFHIMSWGNFFQGRLHLGANLFGIHTARMEVATRGWVGRVGNLAREQDALFPWKRIRAWDG